ncbi:SusC/RagA family TonB-linked outer membrane protein [Rudanella paleaurantiibacter]|uniref:SusC/RagA family TonB-linked outer membrane protein n=1 Tax=Rudanella paleaurantiibacter TaxID=2614655 RepID=A0A7J5U040_9BACT|nr:SusC/RagA family TonB-linked outer membrane protein [Rudanella paleaurantiibacter]KAB7730865.1 SusC/RagA family TonB-linked outer membrane protein [Rudanella paleaurantiibacter]
MKPFLNEWVPRRASLRVLIPHLLFLTLFCQIALAADGQSQQIFGRRITLKVDAKELKTVLSQIENQADVKFAYSRQVVNPNRLVSLNVNQATLAETLDRLLKPLSVSYDYVSGRILLTATGNPAKTTGSVETAPSADVVVTGQVKDAQTNAPLPGVNVAVKGTMRGTTTDASGNYRLSVAGSGDVLIFSFIGYVTKEEIVGSRTEINVTLADDQKQLDEVIVTALGVKREERSLGYAVQKVSGATLQTVKGLNVATSLTGRVSGLWVRNSTEFNEAPTLSLRGETPLLVIDGVPYGNMNLSNIPQDDIESIDVLKGPTAAALYGSRGGSGAVIVTTKRGAGSKGLTVTVNSNNMVNAGFLMLPEVQTGYSAGLGGNYDPTDYVWGAKLDIGLKAMQLNPETKQMELMELQSRGKNNFRDFLVPGMVTNNNISISQTGENGSFRASLTHIYNKGQYPNLKSNAFNFALSGDMKVGDKFNLSSQVGYNRKTAPQVFGSGYSAQGYIYNILMWMGPEYDLSKYQDYWLIPNERQNWHYKAWYDNPYMMAYEKLNGIEQNKMNANLTATLALFPGAKLIVRPGFDWYQNDETKRNPPNILSTRGWDAAGLYSLDKRSGYSFNGDAIMTYNKTFGPFAVDALAGGTMYRWTDQGLYSATRGGIVIPGFYSLNNSVERPNVSTFTNRKQVNSLFAKATLSYQNRLFLDVTGRNDWSSTMPRISRSYFYPSVGGSVVISEFTDALPTWLDFWKVRGSWTMSKSDLGVYATNQTYGTVTADWDNLNSAVYPTTIRGGAVNPETNRTWEIGTSAYFLGKRFKFDAAYFDKYNYNIQRSANISSSSGFTSTLINIDETYVRRGVELSLEGAVMKRANFGWDAVANYSYNHRYFKTLDPTYSAKNSWTTEGGRTDTYTGRVWVTDPTGNVVHRTNGLPLQSDYSYLYGYTDPKFVWGLSNNIRWNNFRFGVSFDGRVGGVLNNYSAYKMWDTGSHPDSDNFWRYDEVVNKNKSYVGTGVVVASGEVKYDNFGNITSDTRQFAKNETKVSYQDYARAYGDGTRGVTNATFLKLRELSIGYNVPAAVARRFGARSATISFTGQNVWMWAKAFRFADPDKADDTQLTSPSVRYVGGNLQLTF